MSIFAEAWFRAMNQATPAQVAHLTATEVLRPAPSTKGDPPMWSCGCVDPELERMQALMEDGMSQTAASRVVWGDEDAEAVA